MWPTDGDAEAAAPVPDGYGPGPDGPGEDGGSADYPSFNGTMNLSPGAPAQQSAGASDRGPAPAGPVPPAGPAANAENGAGPMVPPYPASVTPQGPATRLTAPFAMLTKSRTKTPKPPRPAKPPAPAKIPKKPLPRPQQARPAPAPQAAAGAVGSARKAQLVLSRIEPWSVMKFSFMISLVGWVVLFVAVAFIYFVLTRIGVFHQIEKTVGQVTFTKGHPGSNGASWFAASRVLGYTMLVGAINVVLITALATIGAVVYNLVTHLAGGVEVTLKETD